MEYKEFDKATIFRMGEAVEYTKGGIVSKNVLKRDTGNISLFSFDKGEQLSEHTAPFDAMVQIIEGSAEVRIDGKSYDLKAGDSIIMPANSPHAVYAKDKFKMILTMIKG